jgi:predicted deacylase
MVVFKANVGDRLNAGDLVADILDPLTGCQTQVHAPTTGVMYARALVRFATKGRPLAKIAGSNPRRTGKLLTA